MFYYQSTAKTHTVMYLLLKLWLKNDADIIDISLQSVDRMQLSNCVFSFSKV